MLISFLVVGKMLEEISTLILRKIDTSDASAQQLGGKLKQMAEKAKLIKLAIPLNLSGYSVLTSTSVNQDATTKAVTTKDDDNNSVEITEPIQGESNLTLAFTVQPVFRVLGTGIAIPVPIAIIDASFKKAMELDDPLLVFDYLSGSVVRLGYRIVGYSMQIDSNNSSANFSITLKKSKNEGLGKEALRNYLTGVKKETAISIGSNT